MKILNLSLDTRLDNYNAQYIHTISLAKKLSELGNSILLVIAGSQDELVCQSAYDLLQVRFDPSLDSTNLWHKIFTLFQKNIHLYRSIHRYSKISTEGYDAIYERHNIAVPVGLILSKFYKIPIFFEVNGIPDEEFCETTGIHNHILQKLVYYVCRFQLMHVSAIIVQTQELKDILSRKFRLMNIHIVENGVNPRAQVKVNNNQNKLVFVGAVSRYHNMDDVLYSLARVKSDYVLSVVGDGEYRKKYEKLYRHDKRMIFMGAVAHKEAMKHAMNANIGIASYGLQYPLFKKYGFFFCPLKLLEYSAAGKPTILYGRTNTFIKHFEDAGACLVVNSRESFIKAVNHLLDNPRVVASMGKNALRISKQFTWLRAAKMTVAIINNTI